MKIYLINRETNEIIDTYENVYNWAENFVEFTNGRFDAKHYCNIETEYFTDKEVVETNKEIDNNDK